MATPRIERTLKRRAKARGAAMPEAIVVMCAMLVFLGMNIWAYKAYGGKIDQMNSTRRDALFFASHSCERRNDSDPDSYTHPDLAGTRSSGGASSLSVMGIVNAIRGGGGSFDALATARSEKGPTTIRGMAITKVGADSAVVSPLEAQVRTASAVGCNEKPLGEGITALFRMGWEFLKGLVGAN